MLVKSVPFNLLPFICWNFICRIELRITLVSDMNKLSAIISKVWKLLKNRRTCDCNCGESRHTLQTFSRNLEISRYLVWFIQIKIYSTKSVRVIPTLSLVTNGDSPFSDRSWTSAAPSHPVEVECLHRMLVIFKSITSVCRQFVSPFSIFNFHSHSSWIFD